MTVRTSFVEHFGEECALRIEEASLMHLSETGSVHVNDTWGDDPFKYHFLNAIARECVGRYREYHGIEPEEEELRAWALKYGDLHLFSGEPPDFLAILAGAYVRWINWEKYGRTPPDSQIEADKYRSQLRETPSEQVVARLVAHVGAMGEIVALRDRLKDILDKRKEED